MSQQDNVIIIGAGPSGMIVGCQLQRELGFTNFEIFEKGTDFGGTWYHNTYPGSGCDIPSHFYSFSFEKNPNWTRVFPLQAEIQEYMLNVAKKYNLYKHAHFRTEALSATWDKETERYTVSFKNLGTQEVYTKTCKFLVMCAGPLSVPNPCPVPGADKFKGKIWHSGHWNHDVDITDKNVAVIGNGCSATQFIPVILPKVKSLTQFIRSQHWIFKRPNPFFPEKFKWAMRNIPGAMQLHRFLLAFLLDAQFIMFRTKAGQGMRNFCSKRARRYMTLKAPEKYHDILVPKFEVGAKRRVFDTDYLKCLHDPKILLTNDPLVQINEKSVTTKSGKEYPVDAIVLANGFQIHEPMFPFVLTGKSGEKLKERWVRQQGPRAYMGVTVPDFPNMFMLVGPNTGSGHYSIIFIAECNANFAIKLMKPFLSTGCKGSIEATEDAEKRYVDWVQTRLKEYIWVNSGEAGWYADKNGYNGTIYPHFQAHYWMKTLRPNWSDFKINGAKPSNNLGLGLLLILIAFIGLLLSWLLSGFKQN